MTGDALVKVVFPLDSSDYHGSASESVWAELVHHGLYRLRNCPFFIFGVSLDDIVNGLSNDGRIEFAGVASRGGHSTYRIFLLDEHALTTSAFRSCWQPLRDLGCVFEEGLVLAVDVPPEANIHAAYALLEAGVDAGVWDFEEGHCGHAL